MKYVRINIPMENTHNPMTTPKNTLGCLISLLSNVEYDIIIYIYDDLSLRFYNASIYSASIYSASIYSASNNAL